jgi:hypothetical protein
LRRKRRWSVVGLCSSWRSTLLSAGNCQRKEQNSNARYRRPGFGNNG